MTLTSPKSELGARYDAVVVGSGYGGGVAALRLAEAGWSVCVLERGRELAPEDFPERPSEVLPTVQARIDLRGRSAKVGSRLGLFDFRVHDGVSALVGCGVGGTSLINANVFVVPDEAFFADPAWPRAFRDDTEGRRAAAARSLEVLAPTTDGPEVAKMAAMRALGDALERPATRLPLLVRATTTRTGEDLACNGCGNCVSGCRRGAKNSVDMTYLARARAAGAKIFAELDVAFVRRCGEEWAVHYDPVCRAIDVDGASSFVLARTVILAAGALGSTEILLRSRARGLAVSEALGTRFSANGNVLGALEGIRGHASGRREGAPPTIEPGPCITMAIDVPGPTGLHVEDGTAPRLLGDLVRAVGAYHRTRTALKGALSGAVLRTVTKDLVATAVESIVGGVSDVQPLLVQADDGARGRLVLGAHGVVIDWADFGRSVEHVDETLSRAASRMGARYRTIRPELFGASSHVTVHPLGGCPMGEDSVVGVVDHRCAVFDAASDDLQAIHEGLFVCDGAVLPRAVGRNPAAAICVVAERALALLAPLRTRPRADPPPLRREVRRSFILAEAFDGWLSTESARDPGSPRDDAPFAPIAHAAHAHLTIEVDDLERFARHPSHPASVTGTVTSALFGDEPTCSVVQGRVYLLADDPVDRGVFYNAYDLGLVHPSGERFTLSGTKVWRDGGPLELWGDGTQMPVEIFRGPRDRRTFFAKGLLRMSPSQFVGSVRSYWAKSERTVPKALFGRAEFVAFSLARLQKRLGLRR